MVTQPTIFIASTYFVIREKKMILANCQPHF